MYTQNLCAVAYVDNTIPAQQGQAPAIALFKRALMGQRSTTQDKAFRDSIRALNPAIELSSYIEVTQRHPISGMGPGGGPGYTVLRGGTSGSDSAGIAARAKDTCMQLPDGSLLLAAGQYRYDWRKPLVRELFLEALQAIYSDYDVHGLIVDNAAGFVDVSPDPLIREEMIAARQLAYSDAAVIWPDKFLLLNSDRQFRHANGEMCENRLTQWQTELKAHVGQKAPRFDIGVWTTPTSAPSDAQIQAQMQVAFDQGAWFYWCQNYQQVQTKDFYS